MQKGCFYHVSFGKPGHRKETKLLNEMERKKRRNSSAIRKKKGDKELLMAYSTSGQESKRRQITTWSEKSRKEIDIIYSVGHKAGRNAMYNEGKHH